MAQFTFGGQTVEIPAYKLREVRAAAPYIDRVLAKRRELSAEGAGALSEDEVAEQMSRRDNIMETMTSSISDVLSVIAIGVIKSRQEYPYTPAKIAAVTEEIEAETSMDEMSALNPTFDAILREAGMVRSAASPTMTGSAPAADPLPSGSTDLSQSSSQQDAPAETGNE